MARFAIAAGAAMIILGGGAAAAQERLPEAETRLLSAKQHVETVCRSLEVRRRYRQAAQCYTNVANFLDDPRIDRIEPSRIRVAAPPPAFRPAEPVVRYARRGSGLLLSNYVLSGVGF